MLQPHQERVLAEKEELSEKIEKLSNFIGGQIFYSLSSGEQDRLKRQHKHMGAYLSVLNERIECFREMEKTP